MRLCWPLLALTCLLACKGPETSPPKPAPPALGPRGRFQPPAALDFQVEVEPTLKDAEAARTELQQALADELSSLRGRDAGGGGFPGTPVLKVRLRAYEARPVASPIAYLGAPGLVSAGVGSAAIASASEEMGGLGILLVGMPLVGLGVAGMIVGGIVGGRQIHHDRRRGYGLHPITADAVYTLGREEDGKTFQERYRTRSLQGATRPLPLEALQIPRAVRREMLRALASEIRVDLIRHYEWLVEVRTEPQQPLIPSGSR